MWIAGTVVLLCSVSCFFGCAKIISSECELSTFEGIYAGRYNVGGIIPIPVEDTLIVEVDVDNNSALISSVLLDTSFSTTFLPNQNELVIGALDIPVFNLGEDQLFGITVQDGFSRLDGDCNKLYLQMNKVSVQDHTFDGFPKPINNLDLTTPLFMRRLQ